jgi:hypothetical protein
VANLAKFTINATASSPGGFDATISQVLTLALEGGPASLANRWSVSVYAAADASSPRASKNAPSLTLVGSTSGQNVDAATPGSTITVTMPGSGVHSWIIRSKVNGGLNAKGKVDPDYVFERIVCIKTGSGLRKAIVTEQTQYGPGGWADAQNDLIDAGAGPITAPGGAGDANKLAAANGAGTNLQYAAGIRLVAPTILGFDATGAIVGLQQDASSAATDTARRQFVIAAQPVQGNTSTAGGTLLLTGGSASGTGGTHLGGVARLAGGSATGASGTRIGGDAQVFGGTGATRYGNVFLGTDLDPATFNWQGMGRGIVIQDAQAAPTADSALGFFHWAETGKPTWRFNSTVLRLDGTSAGATAGGTTPPATVAGYLSVTVNGTNRKIPYYAT